jgi:hypothetical protein
MSPTITPPTWSFLGDLGHSRALWAVRCPAITREAAVEWGKELARKLRDEISDGELIDDGWGGRPPRPVPEYDLESYAKYLRAQYLETHTPGIAGGADKATEDEEALGKGWAPTESVAESRDVAVPPAPNRPLFAPQMRDQNRNREADSSTQASALGLAREIQQLKLGVS